MQNNNAFILPENCKFMDVKIIEGDPITGKYSLKTKSGKEFSLEREKYRLVLFQQDKEVGSIVTSSNHSGLVWKGEGSTMAHGAICIGEYDGRAGEYTVLPYENWQLALGKEKNIHPLDYLIENLS